MCVIIIKKQGVKMPSKEILDAAAYVNHDGYGFVSSTGKACKTLNYKEFIKQLQSIKTEDACIIHMRMATHGSVSIKNCHPFLDKKSDIWFAHNGVLPIPSKNDMTDSEICFRETLIPAIKKYGLLSEQFTGVESAIRGSSKFAYMQNGRVYMSGNFIEKNGCYYSNLNFAYMLSHRICS